MALPKILVVDDEPNLVLLLQEWLEEEGYEVYTAGNGKEALQSFYQYKPTLCVIDLIMPEMDGFQLITRIREMSDTHIIVLTALQGEEHLIRGLGLGADQYLVKPVSKRAFLASIGALLRRTTPQEEVSTTYVDGSLSLNFLTHEVQVRGQSPKLRPTEFRLLGFLCQNLHRVVEHKELLDHVWGPSAGSLDSLKWYIHALREKLEENPRSPRLIVTVQGVGYRYRPDDEADDRSGSRASQPEE